MAVLDIIIIIFGGYLRCVEHESKTCNDDDAASLRHDFWSRILLAAWCLFT